MNLPDGWRGLTKKERLWGNDLVAVTPNGRFVRCLGKADKAKLYAIQPANDNYWVTVEGFEAAVEVYEGGSAAADRLRYDPT